MAELVSRVFAGKMNREISDFNNIPMSTVKKHKKDYNNFINMGNSPETYDLTRKIHKCYSAPQDHDIIAGACRNGPLEVRGP